MYTNTRMTMLWFKLKCNTCSILFNHTNFCFNNFSGWTSLVSFQVRRNREGDQPDRKKSLSELQSEMEKNFYQNQSSAVKQCVEFVANRVASNLTRIFKRYKNWVTFDHYWRKQCFKRPVGLYAIIGFCFIPNQFIKFSLSNASYKRQIKIFVFDIFH